MTSSSEKRRHPRLRAAAAWVGQLLAASACFSFAGVTDHPLQAGALGVGVYLIARLAAADIGLEG